MANGKAVSYLSQLAFWNFQKNKRTKNRLSPSPDFLVVPLLARANILRNKYNRKLFINHYSYFMYHFSSAIRREFILGLKHAWKQVSHVTIYYTFYLFIYRCTYTRFRHHHNLKPYWISTDFSRKTFPLRYIATPRHGIERLRR